jgi:FAD:protein FMN transferase
VRRVRDVMGMPVTTDVRDGADPTAALDAVYAELERIDALYSPFRADSLVSQITAGTLDSDAAGGELGEIISLCRRYETETEGYFSAWRGSRFDPSGLVKGWAIDRACRILDMGGFARYFVDAAGDVRTRGEREPGEPWRVGVRHPVERDKVVRVIRARDIAVATSGTYEKGAHIDDPHTGLPATELLSLTVVGPDIVVADVYATAAFALGARGLDLVERLPGYEAYAIDPDLRASWTSGFDAHCERAVSA